MSSAQIALRKALFSALNADDQLKEELGEGRIFDTAPRGQSFPFLRFDEVDSHPLAAFLGEGEEHAITLSVLSRTPSRDQAVIAAYRVASVLEEAPLTLSGHLLVDLRVTEVMTSRLRDGRTFQAEVHLRAVTEPAAA